MFFAGFWIKSQANFAIIFIKISIKKVTLKHNFFSQKSINLC